MKSLKNKLVFAYCALSDESCYGVLTQIRADRGQEWYQVNGREYTHVRRLSREQYYKRITARFCSIYVDLYRSIKVFLGVKARQ